MASYIGTSPANAVNYKSLQVQHFTTSATSTYTLDKSVQGATSIALFINNVRQQPGTGKAYTVSGTTLTLSAATTSSDVMWCLFLDDTLNTDTVQTANIADSAITSAKIADATIGTADLANDAVDGTKIADNAINSEHITNASIDNAHLGTDIDASKIATGTFANARISQASVTQHVTTYDDSNIRADISALALREATNETSAAFNLPNSFIDTFTDDTNLGTQTTVDRVSGYITSIQPAVNIYGGSDSNTLLFLSSFGKANGNTTFTDQSSNAHSATNSGGVVWSDTQSLSGTTCSIYGDGSGDGITWSHNDFQALEANGDYTVEFYFMKLSGEDYNSKSMLDIGQIQQWEFDANEKIWVYNATGGANIKNSGTASSDNAFHHIAYTRQSGVFRLYLDGVQVDNGAPGSPGSSNYTDNNVRLFQHRNTANRWFKGYIDGFRISNNNRYPDGTSFASSLPSFTPLTANATGTLIQSANTVGSAKTQVSGTMLYKDSSGTATLGTDLKIYFTCNGGTNWTEAASYNAITPVYASGIKQVRLGKTTCTSGTDVRYKAVWANQSDGSKVTQLHGIGTNY